MPEEKPIDLMASHDDGGEEGVGFLSQVFFLCV